MRENGCNEAAQIKWKVFFAIFAKAEYQPSLSMYVWIYVCDISTFLNNLMVNHVKHRFSSRLTTRVFNK